MSFWIKMFVLLLCFTNLLVITTSRPISVHPDPLKMILNPMMSSEGLAAMTSDDDELAEEKWRETIFELMMHPPTTTTTTTTTEKPLKYDIIIDSFNGMAVLQIDEYDIPKTQNLTASNLGKKFPNVHRFESTIYSPNPFFPLREKNETTPPTTHGPLPPLPPLIVIENDNLFSKIQSYSSSDFRELMHRFYRTTWDEQIRIRNAILRYIKYLSTNDTPDFRRVYSFINLINSVPPLMKEDSVPFMKPVSPGNGIDPLPPQIFEYKPVGDVLYDANGKPYFN